MSPLKCTGVFQRAAVGVLYIEGGHYKDTALYLYHRARVLQLSQQGRPAQGTQ